MTRPSVYMAWCTRKAECPWCKQLIEVATPSVIVFYWNRGDEQHKPYNTKQHYHPQCWIDQGLDYLNMNPYSSPGVRGRPHSQLSLEDKAKRLLILRKKAALEQQRKRIKTPYPDRLTIEERIDTQIMELMFQISEIGGIPISWMKRLIK